MVPPSLAASAPLAQAPRPQGPQPGQVLVVQGREVPRMGWAMVVVVSKWGLFFVVMWGNATYKNDDLGDVLFLFHPHC